MLEHAKIGSGGYGCVVQPVYPCHDVVLDDSKQYVGKYYSTKVSRKLIQAERSFTHRVLTADPHSQYSIVPIANCKVPVDEIERIVPVCDGTSLRKRQFISQFGGTDLTKASVFVNSLQRVHEVFTNFLNLFEGLALFNGADIYHYDIKQANIVMDDTFTCRFIDWGIAGQDHHFWTNPYPTSAYYPFDFAEATFAKKFDEEEQEAHFDELLYAVGKCADEYSVIMRRAGLRHPQCTAIAHIVPTSAQFISACGPNVAYMNKIFALNPRTALTLKRATKPDVYMLGNTLLRFSISILILPSCTPQMREFVQQFLLSVVHPMLSPLIERRSTPEDAVADMKKFVSGYVASLGADVAAEAGIDIDADVDMDADN
jgi:hypothetical protein